MFIYLCNLESIDIFGTLKAGGPFYPLETGRRDSAVAFKEIAERELPSPQATISVILARFGTRGFNERETVSLFGSDLTSLLSTSLAMLLLCI